VWCTSETDLNLRKLSGSCGAGIELLRIELLGIELLGTELLGIELLGIELLGIELLGIELLGIEATPYCLHAGMNEIIKKNNNLSG
jgi:hypothetical protein